MTNDALPRLLERLVADASLLIESEEATKQGIILPILNRLGWDRDNIREVVPEYRVQNGRVDYCLRVNQKNAVFIEAKRPDQDLDRHQEQLLDYAFREGVELAVLTNGVVWWLYLPLLQGSWEQRKFFTIDISQQDSTSAAGHFESYLNKSGVESGQAVRRAKDLHRSRERERLTAATIPKAWRQLCEEPDEILVELLAEKVESLCGHQPTPDQVASFLERVLSGAETRGTNGPTPQPPRPGPTAPHTRGHRTSEGFTHRRPHSFTFQGSSLQASTWKEVLVGVCRELATRHPENFERVLQMRGRTRVYFSRDFRGMTSPEEIPGTGIYVETNLSANGIVDRCHQVMSLFGYGSDALTVNAQ